MGTGLEAPTWAPISGEEAAEVVARFPAAGTLQGIEWHSPRPFSAGALVIAEQGTFFLKRHHLSLRDAAGLAEEHAFIAHLREQGVPVPEVLTADSGSGTVVSGDWIYELHRRVGGVDLYRERQSWTPFLSPAHARAAGAALARLHDAAESFEAPARDVRPLVSSFTILPAADPLMQAEAYIAARPALATFLADKPWRETFARLLATWGDGLAERLSAQPELWTHSDWHPSNLMWDEAGEVAAVFDFGLADRTCALHDLATALERCVIAWLRIGEGAPLVDFPAVQALLEGYHAVRPLEGEDRRTLAALLPLVHIEFALSEADYFAGVLDDADSAMLAWQGYLIGHADWFESEEGRALLSAIATQGVLT